MKLLLLLIPLLALFSSKYDSKKQTLKTLKKRALKKHFLTFFKKIQIKNNILLTIF